MVKEHIYLIEAEFSSDSGEKISIHSSFAVECRRVYCTLSNFNEYVKQKETTGMHLVDFNVIYDLGIFGFDQEEFERFIKKENK